MTRSIFSQQYDLLRQLLVRSRQQSNLTQMQVAAKLQRPQSFVSKYERGERRLDVIEFLEVARALDVDPSVMIDKIESQDREQSILDL